MVIQCGQSKDGWWAESVQWECRNGVEGRSLSWVFEDELGVSQAAQEEGQLISQRAQTVQRLRGKA